MQDSSALVAFAAFTFILAGTVKGVLGLGLPTVAVGLLSTVMPPAQAVALMLVPSLLTNVWQAFTGGHFVSILLRLWPALLAIIAGTWIAGRLELGLLSPEAASSTRIALGVTLLLYAAIGLAKVQLAVSDRLEPWLGAGIGLVTGMISAVTGIYMIPAVAYYQAIGFTPDEFIQAQGVSYSVSTLALGGLLIGGHALDKTGASASVIAVIPAVLGMLLGQAIRSVTRPAIFRLCFYLGIIGLGLHLAVIHP
ncbi:MAG TPA: sulfite exporter TauE/SafE family protein [Pseudolabrys sp.]|nr:sulfite exporter TauE/SafE family protein [Pseudolabrys sp.]